MLDFQPLLPQDIVRVMPYLARSNSRLCDYTPGALFLWRDYYRTHYALWRDRLYLRMVSPENGGLVFCPPLSAAQAPARERYAPLVSYCEGRGMPLHIALVAQEELPAVLEVFPGSTVKSGRDWCDYLYHSAPMRDFAGKRYSGQRNHVNRFLRSYPRWHFEALGEGNLAAAEEFARDFYKNSTKQNAPLREEHEKTLELLQPQRFLRYKQVGGLLFVGEEIVGFCVGERLRDTLVIHIEKARRDVFGAYPMLVNCFAKQFATQGIDYINREEDVGDSGLRTSKLSYHPIALLEKHLVLV